MDDQGDAYRIVYYTTVSGRSPVREYLEELPERHRRKMVFALKLLAEDGPNLKRPYADHVRGPLRELRVGCSGNQYRALHFFMMGRLAVVVHAFQKKTHELPAREIRTAEGRMTEYLRRVLRGEVTP